MGRSLQQRADIAAAKNKIATLAVDTKRKETVLAYLNKNIRRDRKRARGWTVPDAPERDMNTSDRESAMAQARQKLEENPLVAGMLQTDVDNSIATGFRLSARTTDDGFNRDIEAMWLDQRNKLDIRGVRTWMNLQRMWEMRKKTDGDVGIVLMDEAERYDGVAQSWLQTIEAERIYKQRGAGYDSGIEFDDFGAPRRYFVGPRQKADKPKLQKYDKVFDAKRFILYAHQPHERAERERGVSQFTPILNYFEDLEEILDAMLQKVKNEAFIGLKFKLTPDSNNNPWGPTIQSEAVAEDGKKRQHVSMVSGLNLNLDPNEDAEVMESKAPHSEFVPFIRMMIRLTGLPFGMPLEMILMDPSETNYSGLRSLLEFAKKRFRVSQAESAFIATRIYQWWLSRQKKHNGLKVPKGIENSYWAHRWIPPSWQYLDPQKEATAHETRLRIGITSRHRIIEEECEADYEDIRDELNQERADGFADIGAPAPVEPEEADDDPDDKSGGGSRRGAKARKSKTPA